MATKEEQDVIQACYDVVQNYQKNVIDPVKSDVFMSRDSLDEGGGDKSNSSDYNLGIDIVSDQPNKPSGPMSTG